ncbi:hypothetical protein LINPERHAP2_LOCUS3813 [Linum perenne]
MDFKDWKENCSPAANHLVSQNLFPSHGHYSSPPHSQSSPPPRIPDLVIHCDGSFHKDSQEAAYGVVVSNSHGQVCDGRSGTFFCSSALAAEAKAIKEAISLASTRQVSTVVFSDSLTLVDVLNKTTNPWPWDCSAYIAHMVQNLARCPWIKVGFTPRSHNTKADWVAK